MSTARRACRAYASSPRHSLIALIASLAVSPLGSIVPVTGLRVTPDNPTSNAAGPNKTFVLSFDPTDGDGVRITGQPGGTRTSISIAELEVYRGGLVAPTAASSVSPVVRSRRRGALRPGNKDFASGTNTTVTVFGGFWAPGADCWVQLDDIALDPR